MQRMQTEISTILEGTDEDETSSDSSAGSGSEGEGKSIRTYCNSSVYVVMF